MTQSIKAALTREQWSELRRGRGVRVADESGDVGIAYAHDLDPNGRGVTLERHSEPGGLEQCEVYLPAAVHALLAIGNDALPSRHPAKLTRADVDALREYSKRLGTMATANCERIASAIESLLPPAST